MCPWLAMGCGPVQFLLRISASRLGKKEQGEWVLRIPSAQQPMLQSCRKGEDRKGK